MSEDAAVYHTKPRAHPRRLSLALRCQAIARHQRKTAETIVGDDEPAAKLRMLLKRCATQIEEHGRKVQVGGGS